MTKLTWDDIEKITTELAHKIEASGFKADYILGITTGGLIPLYFLTKKLGIHNILTVSGHSYDKETKGDLQITYMPDVDLRGKNVLLVDEIVETGDTLKQISHLLKTTYAAGNLKTAVLAVNTEKCQFPPDFHGMEEKGGWVVFPWEQTEFPEYFK